MAEALPEYPDSDFSDDISPLDVSFNEAADFVRKNTSDLNNDQLLELYGLYKQGIEGKCDMPRPSWWDAKGRKKWDAWHALGNLPQNQAKERYIELVSTYDAHTSSTGEAKRETWVAVSSMKKISEPELLNHEMSLIDAARENCAVRIKELITNNPQLKDETDEDGLTALHWAADRDATDALLAVIEAGCALDAVDECGQTALHYAASCGHIESTKILIQAGASLIKDETDCTPMDVAADEEIRNFLESVANAS